MFFHNSFRPWAISVDRGNITVLRTGGNRICKQAARGYFNEDLQENKTLQGGPLRRT